jgi:DNA-binding NarL/FixJ family response regulator
MTDSSRILLVESGDYFQDIFLLNTIPNTEVVGTITSGSEAMGQYHLMQPDVIFIDMILKDMTGLEVARWIREQNKEIKIILFSLELRLEFLLAGIDSGIDGYLQKNADSETITHAIAAVRKGQFFTQRPAEVIKNKIG